VQIRRGLGPAILLAFVLIALPGAGAPAALDGQPAQLDALRQQCVTAALSVQHRERAIGALDMAIGVMERGAGVKDEEIARSRNEQTALLGALARLARAPPEALAFAPEGPIDRLRSGILIAAAVPALTAEARELGGQLTALETVRKQIDARRKDVDGARDALAQGRDELAQLIARRNALIAQLLHDDGKTDGKPVAAGQLGDLASDLVDLIKRADADIDQRDKAQQSRLRVLAGQTAKGATAVVDPTRPKDLRGFDAPRAEMIWPVSGELIHRFGEADAHGRPSQGLTLEGVPNGIVVAPFDGRVDYVGKFRDYGPILIIRHAGGYHSLLAGLGRVDVTAGQWLLAGEPVGALPASDDKDVSTSFYLELRRDGRPVDPQSRLGSRDQKTEDKRVRE
jgi:septal ring factor EnvC (AmiA/AmiB activator)